MAILYMQHGISLECLSDFARLFQDAGHKVPADGRTIARTRKEKVGEVDFIHLGLIAGIKRKLPKGIEGDKIWLQINADGTPIFKTNTKELWPILCRILNCNDSQVSIIIAQLSLRKSSSVLICFIHFISKYSHLL